MSAQRQREETALKTVEVKAGKGGEAAPRLKVGRGEPVTAFPHDKVKVQARKTWAGKKAFSFFFVFELGKGVLRAAWERGRARGPWPGGEPDACSIPQPTGWMSTGQVPSPGCEQSLHPAKDGFETLEDAAEATVPEDAHSYDRLLPGKLLLQLLRSLFLPKSSQERQRKRSQAAEPVGPQLTLQQLFA